MNFEILSEFETPFFTVKQLYDSIFATFTKPDAAVGGNSLIVDLGGKTFIFDTFMTLAPAKSLLETAKKLTGNSHFIIGNSHFHFDHIRGNQVFPEDSIIISSKETRQIMSTRSISDVEKNKENWPKELQAEKEKLPLEQDPVKRKEIETDISVYEQLLKELPELTIRLPDISFDSKVIYQGKKRDVHLITFGGAHTPSDVVLYLPTEKILHAGDVILNKNHFFMGDGLPLNWKGILEKISTLDFTILVPGHGDVGDKSILTTAMNYLQILENLAIKALESSDMEEQILNNPPPKPFDSWSGGNESFLNNLKVMMTSIKNKRNLKKKS